MMFSLEWHCCDVFSSCLTQAYKNDNSYGVIESWDRDNLFSRIFSAGNDKSEFLWVWA